MPTHAPRVCCDCGDSLPAHLSRISFSMLKDAFNSLLQGLRAITLPL